MDHPAAVMQKAKWPEEVVPAPCFRRNPSPRAQPWRALRNDHHSRAQKMNLTIGEWLCEHERQHEDVRALALV